MFLPASTTQGSLRCWRPGTTGPRRRNSAPLPLPASAIASCASSAITACSIDARVHSTTRISRRGLRRAAIPNRSPSSGAAGRPQLAVGLYQRLEGEGFVEAAGVWQEPGRGTGKPCGIPAPCDVRLIHHRQEGALAEKSDRAWGVATHLGFEARPRPPKFVRRHIDGPSCRTFDDSGQAAPVLEQATLLVRLKTDIGEAGEMQHRPEAIAAAGEVVAGDRSGPWRGHAQKD